jgi:hypothetical protein
VDEESQDQVAERLRSLAAAPETLQGLQWHCRQVYQDHFSRRRVMDEWHAELLGVLPAAAADPEAIAAPVAGHAPIPAWSRRRRPGPVAAAGARPAEERV